MNYLHKKDAKKSIELREEYLKFVYKNHVYSILFIQGPNKHQKINQALAYIDSHPQYLREFSGNRKRSESDSSILRGWKEGHYGEYRIIDITPDYIELYSKDRDSLYRMKAIGMYLLDDVRNVLPEHRWKGSSFQYRNEFISDPAAKILIEQSATLKEAEDFYESIVRHRNVKGTYVNDQDITYNPLPERIEHDNFSGLMHGFIVPMESANNLSLQEFVVLIKLASLG